MLLLRIILFSAFNSSSELWSQPSLCIYGSGAGALLLFSSIILVSILLCCKKCRRTHRLDMEMSQSPNERVALPEDGSNGKCHNETTSHEIRLESTSSNPDLATILAWESNITLSEKHLEKLTSILSLVMTQWWEIGRQLGLSPVELMEVKSSTDSQKEQFRHMLKIWVTKPGSEPTLRALCITLEEVNLKGMATELVHQSASLNNY